MCDTNRRCDRPSCPCNEPDTELKDALTRMQERFPGWTCDLFLSSDEVRWLATAGLGRDEDVCVQVYGPTPHAAVDAAISAWDAAVKADALYAVLKAECEAWRAHKAYTVGFDRNGYSMAHAADLANARAAAIAATDKSGALR